MMKYLASLIILFSLSEATAQNDSLMPNLSANYQVQCYDNTQMAYEQHIFFINPNPAYDTVDVYSEYDELFAKLYMDTLKVWIKRISYIPDCYVGWIEEEFTNEWELLYDFGLEVGDTAYSNQGGSGLITSIEEIEVQGQIRKKFIIDEGMNSYIQGVGDRNHPFISKMFMFENGYEICTSQLYYSGPSPIDSITYSLDCNGEILSIRQVELANFKVYPNPANTYIEFEYSTQITSRNIILRIVDVQGKPVKSLNLSEAKAGIKVLDTSKLINGVYFYEFLQDDNRIQSGKFIVQH